jgi:hypothetical protein
VVSEAQLEYEFSVVIFNSDSTAVDVGRLANGNLTAAMRRDSADHAVALVGPVRVFGLHELEADGAPRTSAVQFDGSGRILDVGARQIGVQLFRSLQIFCKRLTLPRHQFLRGPATQPKTSTLLCIHRF